MFIGIIAKKIGMTYIFDKENNFIPVTILQTSPSIIIDIKNLNNEYNIIQIGSWILDYKKQKNLKKSKLSFFLKKKTSIFEYIKEYKINKNFEFKIGDNIDLNFLKINDKIKISGLSIGKGTLGNIKRHNFKRGPMTHGSKHHRLQGSLGAGTTPGRVFPGKKMSGRVGNKKITFKGIKIMDINYKENILIVKGSIPGKFGNSIHILKI